MRIILIILLKEQEIIIQEALKWKRKEQIEDAWDNITIKKLRAEIEKRMEELAKSPETAEGGVEKVYEKARERIMVEYIKDRAAKHPKTAEQIKVLEREFKGNGAEVNVGDFIGDVLPDEDGKLKGRFKSLTFWGPKTNNINFGIMRKCLSEDYGLNVSAEAIKKIVTEEKYNKAITAKKGNTGLMHLLLEVVGEAYNLGGKEHNKKEK